MPDPILENIETRYLREYLGQLPTGPGNAAVGVDLTAVAGLMNTATAQALVESYTAAAIQPAITNRIADEPTAVAGLDDTELMTPKVTRDATDARIAVARSSSFAGATSQLRFSAALSWMQANSGRVQVDEPVTLSSAITLFDSVDIETVGNGEIVGTGTGRGILIIKNTPQNITTFSAVGTEIFPATTGTVNSYIDVADASALQLHDTLYIKNTATNAYSETSSCLAEIANVVAVSGTRVYLDRRLKNPLSSGSVMRLPKDSCRVHGRIRGNTASVRTAAVWLEGYVSPDIDLQINGNSSGGLLIMSCFGGTAKVVATDLDNKPAEQRYGYAIVAYGATRGMKLFINATNVRHAYTDGIYSSSGLESGNVLDMVVTGVCNSATAAAWDTHPDSDGVVFDIEAWQGHNDLLQTDASLTYALQLRGANATVKSLITDLERCILIKELRHRNSLNTFDNVIHRGKLIGSPSSSNKLFGVVYDDILPGDISNPITQTGTQKCVFRNCDLTTINYLSGKVVDFDEYRNCRFDWSQTNSGWPSSSNAGGKHRYINCEIERPVNMTVSGTEDYFLRGTSVRISASTSFLLLAGSSLTMIDSGIEAVGFSVAGAAVARCSITSGMATFKYADLWVNDDRAEGSFSPFQDTTSGTGVLVTKDLSAMRERKGVESRGDADVSLVIGTNTTVQRFANTFAADRTVTLPSTNVKAGDMFVILRTGGGAFNLNVGGLKTLAQNQWCEVVRDASVWRLTEFGSL